MRAQASALSEVHISNENPAQRFSFEEFSYSWNPYTLQAS